MAQKVRNLLNRQGRYYARLTVPAELREIVGSRELTAPLGADRNEALRLHPAMLAKFQARLEAARRQLEADNPKAIRPHRRLTVREMARQHYESELRQDDVDRFGGLPESLRLFTRDAAPAYAKALRKLLSGIVTDEERAEGFVAATIGWAIDAMRDAGHTITKPGTPEYEELSKALATAQLEALQRQNERDQGNFDGKPSSPILNDPAPLSDDPIAARILSADSAKPLSEILPLFLSGRNTSQSMANEHHVSARMFEEFLGEPKPVYKITRQDVRGYMKALQETPANYVKRFPGNTLPQAIRTQCRAQDTVRPASAAHDQ